MKTISVRMWRDKFKKIKVKIENKELNLLKI
jgi:hypothetical protein